MTFGNILKKLRKEKNFTRYELAEKLNVSYSTIAHYENNHRLPDSNILKDLSMIFNVSTDYLLGSDTGYIKNEQILIDYNNLSEDGKKDFKSYLELLKIREEHFKDYK